SDSLSNTIASIEVFPLSLHDALPIFLHERDLERVAQHFLAGEHAGLGSAAHRVGGFRHRYAHPEQAEEPNEPVQSGFHGCLPARDRKSTRLNSSHVKISYAVFCLKKK